MVDSYAATMGFHRSIEYIALEEFPGDVNRDQDDSEVISASHDKGHSTSVEGEKGTWLEGWPKAIVITTLITTTFLVSQI